MAVVSGFTKSTEELLQQTSAIRASIFATKKSFNKINKVFERRTKIRSQIFRNREISNARKIEALNRKEQREAFEGAKFSIRTPARPNVRLTAPGKGFLGRIMDFIGSLAIGWILSNLPVWIKWGNAFIKKAQTIWTSLSNFVTAGYRAMVSFGDTLRNVSSAMANFEFAKVPGEINNGMNEFEKQLGLMSDEFEKGFGLFDELKLEDVQGQAETAEPTPQEQSGAAVPAGTYGTGRSYYSEGGTKITDVGGKDYGTYIPGGFGSRGSARVHGVGGQRGHTGEDYAMPIGTPLTMIAKGTVIDVETNVARGGGYGKFVTIQLDSGEYVKLAHLDSVNVRKGDRVGAGTGPGGTAKVVGFSGDTGLSTGPHLHLDYAKSYNPSSSTVSGTMDPMSFINGGGLVKGKNVKSTGEVVEERPASQPASLTKPTPQQTLMGQPAPSGGTLSTEQLVSIAKQAGFNQQNAVIAAAVAKAESGGRSGVVNDNPGTGDLSYGLWQINMIGRLGPARLKQFGITSYEQLKDPLTNAKAAFILSGGSNFNPWSVYKSGKYKSFLPEAQKAAGVAPGQFTATQQQNVPGSITPTQEGEVVFAEFPASGAAVPAGYEGSAPSGGGAATLAAVGPGKSESELLNTFIKNRLLVELSYL